MMGGGESPAQANRLYYFFNAKGHDVSLSGTEAYCLLLNNLCTSQESLLVITFLTSFMTLLLMNIGRLTVNSLFQQQNK